MFKGKKSTGRSVAEEMLICLGLSALVIILTSLVGALIASGLKDPTGSLGLISLGAMVVSAIVSGLFSARFGDGSLRRSALEALAVVLIMLLVGVIISAGRVSGGAFMNYGCYFGIYLLSAYLGRRKHGHRRHRR